MRVRATGVVALVCASAVLVMLTACVRTGTCVSWVHFDTPQDAYDDATLVVIGTAEPTGSTRDVFGVAMPVYAIDVAETLKGRAPDTLEVAPAPLTCMGEGVSEFADGVDPLATDEELVLLLHDDGGWRTITPYDGVLTVPDDGVLPFEAG